MQEKKVESATGWKKQCRTGNNFYCQNFILFSQNVDVPPSPFQNNWCLITHRSMFVINFQKPVAIQDPNYEGHLVLHSPFCFGPRLTYGGLCMGHRLKHFTHMLLPNCWLVKAGVTIATETTGIYIIVHLQVIIWSQKCSGPIILFFCTNS